VKIGGIQKLSLIDYPGKICAIIFTQGCNFRCPYCHNPELVLPQMYGEIIPEEDIFGFLQKRKGSLDGVEITGGEPLLHKDIGVFLRKIKQMDYTVKLDTNGSFPNRLKDIIRNRLADYIAMDIKAPLEKYNFIAGVKVNTEDIKKSIRIIVRSGLDYHFRTTVVKGLLTIKDIKQIRRLVKKEGGQRHTLQKFRFSGKILDNSLLERLGYNEK